MQLPLTGGCQCKKVWFEINAEPSTVYACHCTECQKQSGSAFALSMILPRGSIVITAGEPKTWLRHHESGRLIDCVFCGECGSRLYHNPHSNQKVTIFKPGTLDDTTWFKPVGHIWIKSAQPWVNIPPTSITYDAQPPDLSRLIEAWRQAAP
ncbi:MAG TPA: GFA family protein [Xanthobacteraceae bacterium]|jgi:hypothetical protein|nr:GFA family protein [Xanthobacteraceae bacterium]